MKRYLLFAFIIPLLFSCNNDAEELDESQVSIATVENPSQSTKFYLNLEDSSRLYAADCELKYYRPFDGQRVIVDYTILSNKLNGSTYDHDVLVNDVYEILTKNVFDITPSTQDSIGNDPVRFTNMWIAGDYMNFEFVYAGYSKMHYINLVKDNSKTYTDGKTHLEFRHNANTDYPSYNFSGIVSFNIKSLRESGKNSIELVIHTNEYNTSAERTYNFTYKYNSTANPVSPLKIKIPVTKAKVK